jgi:hypothetical protein
MTKIHYVCYFLFLFLNLKCSNKENIWKFTVFSINFFRTKFFGKSASNF